MIELFRKYESRAVFEDAYTKMSNEISSLTDEQILQTDIDELTSYYVNKYYIEPVVLHYEHVERDIKHIKVQRYNHWFKHDQYEPEFYTHDGYSLSYAIPFDGEADLFYVQPNYYIMTRIMAERISPSTAREYGKIIIAIEYTEQELSQFTAQETNPNDSFENHFKNHADMIDHVNNEVISFNDSLQARVSSCLAARKSKADKYIELSQKLNIPLKLSGFAPNTIPVPLKKQPASRPTFPTKKESPSSYQITDDNYDNIKRIIHTQCTSMEVTAKTYIKLVEEELRDCILATLNTHYKNTTGETFRKVGKTDIQIAFDNKAVFIAECKIWRGGKQFCEALKQLLSYTTWRDSKTSLIIFNKNNQNFQKILNLVYDLMVDDAKCSSVKKVDANWFECIYRHDTDQQSISVQIVIYDLYNEGSVL